MEHTGEAFGYAVCLQWMNANARAQNSERELTPSPQSVTAIAGTRAMEHTGEAFGYAVCLQWMNANARAQNSERELTVHGWEGGPQEVAATNGR